MPQPDNRQAILDQFTRQAVPFSTAPGIRGEEALRLLVSASGASPSDTVLDGAIHFAYPVAILVARRGR